MDIIPPVKGGIILHSSCMDNNFDTDTVRAFLKKTPPFRFLTETELDSVFTTLQSTFYPKGTVILKQDSTPSEFLHIIYQGEVKVTRTTKDGGVIFIDLRGEGDTIGFLSLLSGDRAKANVIAIEDTLCYLMEKKTAVSLFASNSAFSDYIITSHLEQYVEKPYKTMGRPLLHFTSSNKLLYKTRIGDLAIKDAAIIQADATIQEAAITMSDGGVSSLIIVNQQENPVGIITDRDLRQKVVAAGRAPSDSVQKIMTSSLVMVDSQAYYFEAILKMLQHNIHHLIVMHNGKLKGIFSNHDLMILQGTSPLTIVRDIESQHSVEGLISESRNINGVISHLLTVGAKASEITRIITEINEQLLRRLLQLTENKLGPPPVPFCWIVFGSEGRKEQTYKTDQDNAILYADPLPETDTRRIDDYFSSFAEHMRDALLQCGFPPCPGNYMATNPQWRQPLKTWEDYFSQWIATPTSEAVLSSCIVFDFRPVYGDFTLADRLKNHLLHKLEGKDIFLRHMAQLSIQVRSPVGFFRTFAVEKSGKYKNKMNLKFTCLAPIINIVRLFSLESRIPETATMERMQALKNTHTILKEFGDELENAFEFISLLRIRLQHEQIEKGLEPDNYLDPKQLNMYERRVLKQSCQLIAKLQDIINKRYNPGTGSILS